MHPRLYKGFIITRNEQPNGLRWRAWRDGQSFRADTLAGIKLLISSAR